MRDSTQWSKVLVKELTDQAVRPLLGSLRPAEFCALELGLSFMADHMPEQGIGALWPVLSTYAVVSEQSQPQVRALRQLMGGVARSGAWREKLNTYARLPEQVRGFDPGELRGRKVEHGTVFTRRPSPYAAGRHEVYRQVLEQPAPYTSPTLHAPAPPGALCNFRRDDGSVEQVLIPETFAPDPPPPVLEPVRSRTRTPLPVTSEDLHWAAEQLDALLAEHPQITNRDFVKRLEDMDFAAVDAVSGTLVGPVDGFTIDGVFGLVGLMNSGKSTLLDLLALIAVRRGGKVGYLLSSGSDVYAKVSFLRALGITAVPFFGRNTAGEHAERYWRSQLHDGTTTFPDGDDPAADFADDQCYLEDLRTSNRPDHAPLPRKERPCQNKLTVVGTRRTVDCPLFAVCPSQATARASTDAQLWVTTPAGLASMATPSSNADMRLYEAAQHHLDLLLVDEADTVQQQFDDRFLQHEILTQPGRGWSDRVLAQIDRQLEHSWRRDILTPDFKAINRAARQHEQALTELYTLLLESTGVVLRDVVNEGPFTGYSLLRRLARVLHGLTARRDWQGQTELEDQADLFFEEHFEPLLSNPFQAPPEAWAELTQAMTATHETTITAQEAALAWLAKHRPAPDDTTPDGLEELARLLQAGLWTARITASFFTMAQLLPAVSSSPGDGLEDFWSNQPPRDLQTFIPEQAAGNLMALQWQANREGDSGSFSVLWLRGVGRWLLYHLHDLLAPEGIEGPNVVLASATSWMPASPRFHLDTPPSLILREPPKARAALEESRMFFRPARYADGRPVFVSGTGGNPARRQAALAAVTDSICTPRPGALLPLLEQVREHLAEDRQQVLFTVQSTRDAETVAEFINHKTRYTALHVIREEDPPTAYSLARRRLGTFASTGADILVAAEGAVQRGHNILNARRVAALGAVFYLARIHPPADDATFPLSLLSREAMRRLHDPVDLTAPGASPGDIARTLRHGERNRWRKMVGEPVLFSRLADRTERNAFVGNLLVPLHQTLGRGIRGNEKVLVYLCDAAFAPRTADLDETAPDTERTSVIVAAQKLLHGWLTDPGPDATAAQRRDHALAHACWGLTSRLLDTLDWGLH
ncbi:hypothetical protein V2S66_19205 [Streptomyces sp. V4-01]|uniref:pPIWI-RE three-gene island domain-containing protein n=1 Tax=Actinacidiphila polyblastidii TaxID=3110430 RepID=A0ABU7PEG4_9ACTN|nr:hypothetical protein [Streptomyces sp. V4-01]